MREPLWWIWLSVFSGALLTPHKYDLPRRGEVRMAWFIAGVIRRTCREIRREGTT